MSAARGISRRQHCRRRLCSEPGGRWTQPRECGSGSRGSARGSPGPAGGGRAGHAPGRGRSSRHGWRFGATITTGCGGGRWPARCRTGELSRRRRQFRLWTQRRSWRLQPNPGRNERSPPELGVHVAGPGAYPGLLRPPRAAAALGPGRQGVGSYSGRPAPTRITSWLCSCGRRPARPAQDSDGLLRRGRRPAPRGTGQGRGHLSRPPGSGAHGRRLAECVNGQMRLAARGVQAGKKTPGTNATTRLMA